METPFGGGGWSVLVTTLQNLGLSRVAQVMIHAVQPWWFLHAVYKFLHVVYTFLRVVYSKYMQSTVSCPSGARWLIT